MYFVCLRRASALLVVATLHNPSAKWPDTVHSRPHYTDTVHSVLAAFACTTGLDSNFLVHACLRDGDIVVDFRLAANVPSFTTYQNT